MKRVRMTPHVRQGQPLGDDKSHRTTMILRRHNEKQLYGKKRPFCNHAANTNQGRSIQVLPMMQSMTCLILVIGSGRVNAFSSVPPHGLIQVPTRRFRHASDVRRGKQVPDTILSFQTRGVFSKHLGFSSRGALLSTVSEISTGDSDIQQAMSENQYNQNDVDVVSEWDVYVCQSKASMERGAGATLGAFIGLAPSNVYVRPAVIQRTKGKGPTVRCVQRGPSEDVVSFEVNQVDSVEKVHRVLTKHMGVKGVDPAACECLKWNYRGNAHLDRGDLTQAIKSYDRAMAANYPNQEGVLRVMRATAYLQRAFSHRSVLCDLVAELSNAVPSEEQLTGLYNVAAEQPSLAVAVFDRVVADGKAQHLQYQQIQYRHGLYEYALLHATQDALQATRILPEYAKAWVLAGESLAALRKLREAVKYYEKALELDPGLEERLVPLMEGLKQRMDFVEEARGSGWPEDTLRVALDVEV